MAVDRETLLAFQISRRVARAYRADSVNVAALCDEQLDRSGNLLGWLREYAQLTDELSHPESPSK